MKLSFKTIVSAVVLAFSSTMLFAAESAYDTLLKKAQSYEAQKKWISAAGTYYDALVALPNENAAEAYNAFFKIINNIAAGNPGNDVYDDFTKADGWAELAKDAEDYFSVNTPYDVFFLYVKGKLNMEKKTCAYTFVPYATVSEKFDTIYSAMIKGMKKVASCPVPENWPSTSIYKNASKTNGAIVATLTLPPATGVGLAQYTTLSKDFEYSAVTEKASFNKSYLIPAFAMADYRIAKNTYAPSFYNITFDIVDEKGKVLASSGKAGLEFKKLTDPSIAYDSRSTPIMSNGLASEPSKIVLNVTSPAITAIDSGKFDVKVTSLTLRDSSISGRMVKEDAFESYIYYTEKVYKETKVSLPYVRGELKIENPDYGYIQASYNNNRLIFETIKKSAEENKLLAQEVKKVTDAKYEIFDDGTHCFFYSVNDISINNVPATNYNSLEPVFNTASTIKGYKPAFSVDGKTDYKEWKSYRNDQRDYWVSKPVVDLTADGYRRLTDEEVNLLHAAVSAKKIARYGDTGRSINPKNKEKIIAEYEADKKAKQEKILAALAKEAESFAPQFLKEPSAYKEDFKKVNGTNIKASPIEVTQGLYEKVMGKNPSKNKIGVLFPVNNVSFYEAAVFCNKLSMAAGLTPAYTLNKSTDPSSWGAIPEKADAKWDKMTVNEKADGFRLPNDAETAAISSRPKYTEPYYVGLQEGSDSKIIEGEKIYLPVVSTKKSSSDLWNTSDNVYEMFKSKKAVGYLKGDSQTAFATNADKDEKVGFRVVCGK